MARLLIKPRVLENRTLELRLGVQSCGSRSGLRFPHRSSHGVHQPLRSGVVNRRRDAPRCGSTNGTFVNGDRSRKRGCCPPDR